jgi:hypothetical protein
MCILAYHIVIAIIIITTIYGMISVFSIKKEINQGWRFAQGLLAGSCIKLNKREEYRYSSCAHCDHYAIFLIKHAALYFLRSL